MKQEATFMCGCKHSICALHEVYACWCLTAAQMTIQQLSCMQRCTDDIRGADTIAGQHLHANALGIVLLV
jgi:hypothetical protein